MLEQERQAWEERLNTLKEEERVKRARLRGELAAERQGHDETRTELRRLTMRYRSSVSPALSSLAVYLGRSLALYLRLTGLVVRARRTTSSA